MTWKRTLVGVVAPSSPCPILHPWARADCVACRLLRFAQSKPWWALILRSQQALATLLFVPTGTPRQWARGYGR